MFLPNWSNFTENGLKRFQGIIPPVSAIGKGLLNADMPCIHGFLAEEIPGFAPMVRVILHTGSQKFPDSILVTRIIMNLPKRELSAVSNLRGSGGVITMLYIIKNLETELKL